ncbi:type II toxin-antitoxin system RelE/ParE family toxin [Sulfidibacter corallicola]|uniref:type II toxin-antitoxin system RelE/ParE family toxin n=1 Tax=Sulfidibacter corallicola TaxID=2818388 RepID=UPI003B214344
MTDTAKADLRNIRRHFAKDNPDAARAFMSDLVNKLHNLAAIGMVGSPRDHIRKGLRGFPYRGRCFYWYIEGGNMYVIRVLHGKQDIAQQDFRFGTGRPGSP